MGDWPCGQSFGQGTGAPAEVTRRVGMVLVSISRPVPSPLHQLPVELFCAPGPELSPGMPSPLGDAGFGRRVRRRESGTGAEGGAQGGRSVC